METRDLRHEDTKSPHSELPDQFSCMGLEKAGAIEGTLLYSSNLKAFTKSAGLGAAKAA